MGDEAPSPPLPTYGNPYGGFGGGYGGYGGFWPGMSIPNPMPGAGMGPAYNPMYMNQVSTFDSHCQCMGQWSLLSGHGDGNGNGYGHADGMLRYPRLEAFKTNSS